MLTGVISGHLRRLDHLLQRATFMCTLEQQRGHAELVNELPGLLGQVEPSAVSSAAAAWMRPNRRAVLEVRAAGARR